jgi:hypothetical protein
MRFLGIVIVHKTGNNPVTTKFAIFNRIDMNTDEWNLAVFF